MPNPSTSFNAVGTVAGLVRIARITFSFLLLIATTSDVGIKGSYSTSVRVVVFRSSMSMKAISMGLNKNARSPKKRIIVPIKNENGVSMVRGGEEKRWKEVDKKQGFSPSAGWTSDALFCFVLLCCKFGIRELVTRQGALLRIYVAQGQLSLRDVVRH